MLHWHFLESCVYMFISVALRVGVWLKSSSEDQNKERWIASVAHLSNKVVLHIGPWPQTPTER